MPSTELKRRMRFAATVFILISNLSIAETQRPLELCSGFVPDNNLEFPVGFKSALAGGSGLTRAQFDAVLNKVEFIYRPIVSAAGGNLVIARDWKNAKVNAYATQVKNDWYLVMYGGLARHPSITKDGFALVACHELGHHLGGTPFRIETRPAPYPTGQPMWHTNEGGADYFATLKCLRYVFAGEDNKTVVEDAKAQGALSAYAAKLCDREFSQDSDRLVCKRITLASDSAADFFRSLRKETIRPRFNTPDLWQATTVFDDHPGTQCRLDTYFAGSICDVDKSVPVSVHDYRQGTCVENVAKVGFRPRCWFVP